MYKIDCYNFELDISISLRLVIAILILVSLVWYKPDIFDIRLIL